MVSEFSNSGSLDELIQACGGLPEDAIREIAHAVLSALHVLHSVEPPVVHGCLKPSQVLFSADGRPRLAFGLEQRLNRCQAIAAATTGMSAAAGAAGGSVFVDQDAEQQSTAVDIFDLGLLLLVSALGGMDVLLDAIPYAREFGARSARGPSAPLSVVSADTCALLQRELQGAAAAAAAARCEVFGTPADAGDGSTMGYLPPASDLLFNRRYSEPFLAFISTCLEAHTRAEPVSACDLLQHAFLQGQGTAGPIVSLHEMQELARLLNETPEQDPSRFGPGKSSRYAVPGIAPTIVQSAQLYLANIAEAIAPHCGSGEVFEQRALEWDTVLLDSARTLGLPRDVVQKALEVHLGRLVDSGNHVWIR
jgi:serine/threonine protein kinase